MNEWIQGLLTLVRKETKDEKWKSCHQLATADALKQLTSHEDTVGATTEKLVSTEGRRISID